MKATGIVRRIDDLGRVVIPKEIRRTMRIREGDPLEIYISSNEEVIFKKYSPVKELSSFAGDYAEALTSGTNLSLIICDRDKCICAAGVSKKETLDKDITTDLENIIDSRQTFVNDTNKTINALMGSEKNICAATPIISSGDIRGSIVLLENEQYGKAEASDVRLINVAAKFLGNRMS